MISLLLQVEIQFEESSNPLYDSKDQGHYSNSPPTSKKEKTKNTILLTSETILRIATA